MQILYDNIIFQLQKVGGISIYWKELLTRLIKDNFDVKLIPGKNEHQNFIFQELLRENPCISKINTWNPLINYRYLPIFKPLNNKRLIFHSSYYRPIFGKDIKVVTTIHDFIYEHFDRGLKKNVHSIQKKSSIMNADVVICISENTKYDLLDFYPNFRNKDIRVIYNGVSEAYYPLKEFSYRQQEKPYLLVVGNRVGCKNFEQTMIAFRENLHNRFRLVVVGKPLSDSEKLCLDTTIDKVTVKSNVSEPDLNVLYNNAEALVFPSTYEGFGIPIIEAMRAGCPVITTKMSCINEVAGHAGVYMEEPNAKSIVDSLNRLNNLEYRQEIIDSGLIQSSKFSWDNTYRQIIEIYKELYNA